jgi:glycosyltransferase involved in cell wall biosynthesis
MLSIVVPVYNEFESLAELHGELDDVARRCGWSIEVIFVDDGSSDGSWDVIRGLAEQDRRVKGIRFRRNFGKAAALSAGIDAARGELVFTLDADLQDDPREMPRFLAEMDHGFDVVSGWKQRRHDPWHKVWPSKVFNWLVGYLTGVQLHDHNCGFKCYRREIFDEVRLYGELHRFVPVLAAARGWRVGELVVHHRARRFGYSKYGVRRFVKGFLDLLTVCFLTGYGQRPQHLLGGLGLLAFFLGGIGLVVLSMGWVITRLNAAPNDDLHLHDRAIFFFSMVSLLLGAQCLSIGFLAEMITAASARDVVPYSVRERIGEEASEQVSGTLAAGQVRESTSSLSSRHLFESGIRTGEIVDSRDTDRGSTGSPAGDGPVA